MYRYVARIRSGDFENFGTLSTRKISGIRTQTKRKKMTVICIGGCCVPLESLVPFLLLSLSKYGKKLMHWIWYYFPFVERVFPFGLGEKFVPPLEVAKRRKRERLGRREKEESEGDETKENKTKK